MKKLLTLLFTVISLSLSAQYTVTGVKMRQYNGIAVSMRDTASFGPADSTLLTIGYDSVVYFKIKGYWRPVSLDRGLAAKIAYSDTTSLIQTQYGASQTYAPLTGATFTGAIYTPSATVNGTLNLLGNPSPSIDSVVGKTIGSNQLRTVAIQQLPIYSVTAESQIASYTGSAPVIVSSDTLYPGIFFYSPYSYTPVTHYVIAATGIGSGYWLYRYTPYSGLSGLPTTLAGYGITDATKFKTVASYALMIADGTPSVATLYEVITDENKSYSRSTYIWKPNGNREWIASTTDN